MSTLERKYRRIRQELVGGVIALILVFLLGTLWYRFVEEWSWLDATYMTMSTLATVGFGEINPLGPRGRVFTMALIVMGLMSIGYIINRFTEALIQGYFQEGIRVRQERSVLEKLVNHYILCGFGRTGRQVASEFEAENIPFVIIDSESDQVEKAKEMGYRVILGDATLDESLQVAKIEKAICLVAALSSDAENLYTVLSAKSLNPKIRAIARASSEEASLKLQRAGADAVVSPYITGGRRLAAAAVRPQVMDFVDGILTGSDRSFYMEEFLIHPQSCPFVGATLAEAEIRTNSGALVLAIRRADGSLIGGPTGETELRAGDLLICMGTAEQLRLLNQILAPMQTSSFRQPYQQ